MQIYLARPGGQKEGPFTLEQINRDLAGGKYTANDYWAWHDGMASWTPLHALPGINITPVPPVASKPAAAPPPKPAPAPTGRPQPPPSPRPGRRNPRPGPRRSRRNTKAHTGPAASKTSSRSNSRS